jgi:hypothetical protein
MELSNNDELRVIKEALLKAKARSETEGFAMEKRSIESFRTAPDEKLGALVQDWYNRLLDKIQDSIGRG